MELMDKSLFLCHKLLTKGQQLTQKQQIFLQKLEIQSESSHERGREAARMVTLLLGQVLGCCGGPFLSFSPFEPPQSQNMHQVTESVRNDGL